MFGFIGDAANAVGGLFSSKGSQNGPVQAPDKSNFTMGGGGADIQSNAFNTRANVRDAQGQNFLNQAGVAQQRRGATANYGATNAAANEAGQSRQAQMANVLGIQNFANQGPGPSEAQAQLQASQNAAFAQNAALAQGSGRGLAGAGAAQMQAGQNNAAVQSQIAGQGAMLRAQEAQNFRNQQLSALGLAQQGLQGVGGQSLQEQAQQAQQAQFNTQQETQQRGMNDQLTAALLQANQGQGALSLGEQQLGYGALKDQLQANENYAQLSQGGQIANVQNDQQRDAQLLGTVGGLAGAAMMMSDAREKKNARAEGARDMAAALGVATETTPLTPEDESKFQIWALRNGVQDANDPRAHYDYRGFWKEHPNAAPRFGRDHFPDTYKQHGHPTFSVESQYSRNAQDGGAWEGERYIPPVTPAAQFDQNALDAAQLRQGGTITTPAPAYDLRPAQGYRYEYKNPQAPGAAPGVHYGPMAQDLERTPAGASAVVHAPDGTRMVDPGRLTLVNTAALSEQQRRQDDLEQRMLALGLTKEKLHKMREDSARRGERKLFNEPEYEGVQSGRGAGERAARMLGA